MYELLELNSAVHGTTETKPDSCSVLSDTGNRTFDLQIINSLTIRAQLPQEVEVKKCLKVSSHILDFFILVSTVIIHSLLFMLCSVRAGLV